MVKPIIKKGLEYVVDTLGNKIGALPSTSKSIADYSDIINQGVRLDTADAYKNLFHVDTEFAKGYGGELKSGSLKYGSDDMPPSLTDKELIDAQNEIKGLTQDYLKDLPDDLTVYRYGDLDNETGVSSFTLNPNYNVDSSLPWQKRLQSPMQTFKVKKEDVLASPDINAFFGGGRGFDEQEVIIGNDKVGALPSSNELYRFEKPKYRFSESKAIETSKLFKSVNKFPALSKSEETLVASSSAPVNEIAGLGRVKIEKIDPNDMAGSKKRFDELKALTSGYKQDRAKATIIRLENGENAIQYMQPPTEVKKLNISDLIATQDNVVLGTNKTADDVMPLVVKKDGKFFIRDGHHRIAQNINSGDKTADVRLIDLDKGGFLNPKRIGLDFDEQEIIISNDKVSDLGALPKNLTNAKKQGFDIDNKLYHATNSDNITEFREDLIGSSTDEGFFGKGFYFTPNKGEAGYYGKNVGEYFVKGKLLDLTNNSGDYTLGGTVKFVDWAEKLDKIGMLDKVTKDGLRAAKKMHKYLDKNIEYKIGQNPDGTDGVFATIVDPTRKVDIYKGKEYPPTISVMTDNRRFFPKTKEEAKENLLHQFVYQMSNQYDNNGYTKSNDFFKGWNNDILLSLSDYIRVGGKGSAELTKKAKQAGYDGILAPGDEVVVFDPKNIRSTSAEFDPNKSESKNILASMGGMATVGGIGALSGLEEGT
jgi:hypothetical protein